MRNRTVVLAVMCMGLISCGCERKDPSEHSPSIHDERLDPHASVLVLNTEPDLVGDQSQISRRIERARQANPIVLEIPPLPPEPPTAIDQVREKLTDVLGAVKGGQDERILELLTDKTADVLRPIIVSAKEIKEKTTEFEELVRTQLGIELPEQIKATLGQRTGAPSAAGPLGGLDLESLQYEQIGQNVVVTTSSGQTVTFAPVDGDYKMDLPVVAASPEAIGAADELMQAVKTLLDELIAGINAGEITADNLESEVQKIRKRTIGPAMIKMMQRMVPGAPGSSEASSESAEAGRSGATAGTKLEEK